MTKTSAATAWVRPRLARLRHDAVYLLSGIPLWAVPLAVLSVPWTVQVDHVPTSVPAIAASLAVPALFVFGLLPWLSTWQRRRLLARRSVAIVDAETPRFGFRWSSARAAWQSETFWRQAFYHGVVGPAVGLGAVLGASMLLVGGVFFFYWAVQTPMTMTRGELLPIWGDILGILFAALSLVLAPPLLSALVRADVGAARRLLGPSATVELARRVEVLSVSRAAAVEAADAERRRIERDLHDGAQQQLMSLSVNLGIARKTLRDVPDDAMKVIVDAHEQAKEAMAQLRDLVRGLHPAVLDDRGLDAALSGIAARSAVPVKLTVDAAGPISASAETVAYFVVSEALANVVKHSQASKATVDVLADPHLGRLQVRVADDGVGGADPARGTGLEGLRQRVATVDGKLRISSPEGGPTVLTVLLPIERTPATPAADPFADTAAQ